MMENPNVKSVAATILVKTEKGSTLEYDCTTINGLLETAVDIAYVFGNNNDMRKIFDDIIVKMESA